MFYKKKYTEKYILYFRLNFFKITVTGSKWTWGYLEHQVPEIKGFLKLSGASYSVDDNSPFPRLFLSLPVRLIARPVLLLCFPAPVTHLNRRSEPCSCRAALAGDCMPEAGLCCHRCNVSDSSVRRWVAPHPWCWPPCQDRKMYG